MDADIQAFIDGELPERETQTVIDCLSENEGLRTRYEQLLKQKKMLQFLYGRGVYH